MATLDRNPDTIRMTQHADTVTNLRFRQSRAKPFNKPTFETDVVFVVWHNSHGDSDIFEIDTRSHHLNLLHRVDPPQALSRARTGFHSSSRTNATASSVGFEEEYVWCLIVQPEAFNKD